MLDRKDIMCKDGCGFAIFDFILKDILEYGIGLINSVEPHNVSLSIHSACRCEKKNKEVGGMSKSYHLEGLAIDFHIDIVPLVVVEYFMRLAAEYYEVSDFIDIVVKEDYMHMEFDKRRWLKKQQEDIK